MELYKRFPKICLIWCSIEVALYAGQIFGWSALMYVLKEEGFYANVCDDFIVLGNASSNSSYNLHSENGMTTHDTIVDFVGGSENTGIHNGYTVLRTFNESDSLNVQIERMDKYINDSLVNKSASETVIVGQERRDFVTRSYSKYCTGQDSRLNLWFSIAVGFAYVMCGFLGPLMSKIGMRFYRLFFIVIYVIGALCIGFATPVIPWLLCPGLCCTAIAGMALYASNLQVSFLFINIQSTITAALVGLFDVSTVIQQFVKIAFDNNVSRRASYIFLATLHIFLAGFSTFVLLPAIRLDPSSRNIKKTTGSKKDGTTDEKKTFITEDCYKETSSTEERNRQKSQQGKDLEKPRLRHLIFSSQYLLHLYWMAVMALRFVSFIGFLNAWLASMFEEMKVKETYYLGVFSYITMGTIGAALTAGLLHDSQRWRYTGETDYKRTHMPIIIPLTVTTLLSIACTVLTFVPQEGSLYVTFILFTFFRSYLYCYEVTFINDAFPLIHFTELFGILQLFAGVGSMLQYGLFEWFRAYELAPTHVNIFLLILEVSTLAHPLNIWYQGRRKKSYSQPSTGYRLSIEIAGPT